MQANVRQVSHVSVPDHVQPRLQSGQLLLFSAAQEEQWMEQPERVWSNVLQMSSTVVRSSHATHEASFMSVQQFGS